MNRKVGHFESGMMKGSSCKGLYFVFRFSLTFNFVIKASFLGERELERNGVRIKPFISNAGKPQHLNRFPLFLSEKVHCSVSPQFYDGPVLNGSWFLKLCIKSVHASSLAFSTVFLHNLSKYIMKILRHSWVNKTITLVDTGFS